MRHIIKMIAGAVVMVAIHESSVLAADPWSTWVAQINAIMDHTKVEIDTVTNKIRDVRCPQQPSQPARDACVAAYNVIIARIETERAEMKLKVTAVSLPAAQRDQILQKILNGYETFNKETVAMGNQFDLLFPIPQK